MREHGSVRLVIGVPTVRRKRDYVEKTVGLLLSRMGDTRPHQVVIVLLNAEQPAEAHRAVSSIKTRHRAAMAQGLLMVIDAPAITGGEHIPRQGRPGPDGSPSPDQWRAKQVRDAAELMKRCAPLGTHYLHLEDDIHPAPGYAEQIVRCIETARAAGEWRHLVFYSAEPVEHLTPVDLSNYIGAIGLLFRSEDTVRLARALEQRANEGPVDALIGRYLAERGDQLFVHSPPLFEHVGFYSSLPAHIQSNRAWRWAGDRTRLHFLLRRIQRSLHVRWLRFRHRSWRER